MRGIVGLDRIANLTRESTTHCANDALCEALGHWTASQAPLQADCDQERGRCEFVHCDLVLWFFPTNRDLGAGQLDLPTHGHQQTDPSGEIDPPLGTGAHGHSKRVLRALSNVPSVATGRHALETHREAW